MKKMRSSTSRFGKMKRLALGAIASTFTIMFVFMGGFVEMSSTAIAAPMNTSHLMAFGFGTGKQVEGKVDQVIGKGQQDIGQVTGASKGLAKRVQGRAKEDTGRVQDALDKAQSKVERRASRDLDRTQNVLDQTKNQADKTVEKAKDLFQ